MQILRADTLIKVIIGPVVDIADGYTPINTLSLSLADVAEIMKHNASAVTDISANTFTQISGMSGYYNLTISASQLDTEGMLTIGINDNSLCYPVKHEFMVVNANVYDSLYSAAATDYLQVDIQQLNSDSTSADNIKLQYDGTTGLSGAYFPSNQAQLQNLQQGSAAISVVAESAVITTGTQVNTYTATAELDMVYHQVSDSAGVIDMYYQFDVGGNGVGVTVEMQGRLYGANDIINVFAYNWSTASWGQIGQMTGSNGSTDGLSSFNLLAVYTGTGANIGKIRVRGYGTGLTSATLYIDIAYVNYALVTQSVGYANGAVWIDQNLGQAGTTAFVNGVADNPSNNLADAIIIRGLVNLSRFEIAGGTNLTFASDHSDHRFSGQGWTLALGGQNLTGTYIIGANVSGTCVITLDGEETHFQQCEMDACILDHAHLKDCGLRNTITLTAAKQYTFQHCYSQVPGTGTPIIDFGVAIGNTGLNLRDYSGGLELYNMGQAGTDTISIEGDGQLIINVNCIGGTIAIRGNWKIVDNSGGAVTLVYDDNTANIKTLAADLADGGRTDLLIDSIISLLDDPRTEPGQGALPVNPDAMTKIDFIYKFLRNKVTSNATTINVYADDGTTIDHKTSHNDDGITYTRDEFVTGP